jgi:predicted TIM-barrel fold metal-dependent hydrolase
MKATGRDDKFISADGHVMEPANLWVERMERRFRERAPRVVSGTQLPSSSTAGVDPENTDFFVIDGLLAVDFIDMIGPMANDKALGKPVSGRSHNRHAETRIGAMDPKARLADQELDNLRAEVIYPNYGMYLFGAPDLEYRRDGIRVYNDWVSEYCSAAAERLIGVAPVVLGGPLEWAVKEAERAAKLGMRSVLLPTDAPDRPWGDPYYRPLWEALSDLELPVAFHNSASEQFLRPGSSDRPAHGSSAASTAIGAFGIVDVKIGEQLRSLAALLGSAVPQAYPKLRFVIAEGGIGWVAAALRLMDHWWEDHHLWLEPKLEEPPSFYCHRQFWLTFEDDRPGLLTREMLNIDHLMWGSDYPHTEGTFPNSRERITKDFAGVPADQVRKLTANNAAGLYGIR